MQPSKKYIGSFVRLEFFDDTFTDAYFEGFDKKGIYLQTKHDYQNGHENLFIPYTSFKYIHYLTRNQK